jgi:hypothetical protein
MVPDKRFAVFDLETNGFRAASAVSASSIVFTGDGRILDFFNRFYYPEERPDPRTESVHGLTPGRIGHFRKEEEYERHFLGDWTSLAAFWDGWNPEGIVVHNLSFDISFLPPEAVRGRKWWCSMRGLTDFCRIPGSPERGRRWKWPKLAEASSLVRGNLSATGATADTEEMLGSPLPHFGLSDCFELYGIFSRVWNTLPDQVRFRAASAPFLPPGRQSYVLPSPLRDRFTSERMAYAARLAAAAGCREREERLLELA